MLQQHVAPFLRKSQVLLGNQMEPTQCVERLQNFIDGAGDCQFDRPVVQFLRQILAETPGAEAALTLISSCKQQVRCAILADLKQAFERVSQHWITLVLMTHRTAPWLLRGLNYLSANRKVRFILGSKLGPARPVHSGVDQGGNS